MSEEHVFVKDLKGLAMVEEPEKEKVRKRMRAKMAAVPVMESQVIEDAHDALGGRCESVPPEIHATALQLVATGVIPVSTPGVRGRNRRVPGTTYYVQLNMHGLLQHGYIGPNMAPPKGFLWFCHAGNWWLQRRGG